VTEANNLVAKPQTVDQPWVDHHGGGPDLGRPMAWL